MSLVEYHDIPLKEVGILRPDQEEVWYKDVVHDVSLRFRKMVSDSSFGKFRPRSSRLVQK